jgi:hypothetical protein
MDYEKYDNVSYSDDLLEFEFVSTGTKGDIPKLIKYSPYMTDKIYNLALGSIEANGEVNYIDKTNNGDVNKVLATTATTAYKFFELYPDCAIFLTGNIPVKTRLYQMAINSAHEELEKDFRIWGLILDKETQSYSQHEIEKSVNYDAFLIAKRK